MSRYCDLDMNGKVNTAAEKITHSKTANMVSHLSPETSRTPRKGATFGKRSNSMRRNPKAEVTKQGWLYKQASSGVKQWNKRWFVLTDRCLFYYKDDKEDTVLGSLPLLSFQIGGVEPSDNITRKFAFKAEHAGTRTYYFSTDSHEEQEEWIRAMSEASEVNIQLRQRNNSDTKADLNHTMVTKAPDPQAQEHPHTQTHNETDSDQPPYPKINGVDGFETPPPSTPLSNQEGKKNEGRHGGGREGDDERGGSGPDYTPHSDYHPNGCSNYGPRKIGGPSHVPQEQQENVVLRRGFVPRTAPERVAQRKSSMAQLQQWVNQRRGMASQEDINSPSHYYQVSRGVSADYYGYPGGPQYVEEYPLYTSGVRPDSICSVSAFGGYDRRWTIEDKRHSLRDGHQMYGPPVPRDQWGQQYYGGMETSMRRLSIQPRSRSVPRSPSSSSGGPYSPVPHNFASPARSPSARFDRFTGRMRDDVIYADPSVYSLRRSLSSPKYDYPGDRRSLSQGLYHCNYPESPYIHNKMVCVVMYCNTRIIPVHTVTHSPVVDSLEDALVETHQEMELYHNQPLAMEKLRFKKETLQNQLINIRGELSQASSALTTTRMEFEALEDEASAIHGDLWEQLNAGGQSELVRRHIQKEFWRVQDVLEGLHKNHSSRGTDTAKHRGNLLKLENNCIFSGNICVYIIYILMTCYPNLPVFLLHSDHQSPELSKPHQPTQPLLPSAWLPGLPHQTAGPGGKHRTHPLTLCPLPVGIVPPRTKSPTDESHSSSAGVSRYNGRVPNGISRERPKSAVFTAEVKLKMSVEEQNERLRRNQSSSVREKRRSLNLSGGQSPANYKVIRRRLTAHEIDIKDLEAAVRGQGQESPREEIARLRRLQVEPEHFDLDMSKELMAPDKVLIPERYLDVEDNTPLSPEEQKEKQKKLERIKTLIAKSNLQNMVPLLDGPVEGGAPVSSQQQLQEQEKRIEISCALAAEASRRSRLLSDLSNTPFSHSEPTCTCTISCENG
uniref:Pleckstrin homology domain containing, family A member 6 n=1 Tax=Dicentrarchus labrax TaxID=13489 RepID=A0A8C4EG82_DICLA